MNTATRRSTRTQSGQVLPLTAATLIVGAMFMVLIAAFVIDVYAYTEYNNRVQNLAEEVAKFSETRQFFLGARRPMFQTSGQTANSNYEKSVAYAQALKSAMHLPAGCNIDLDMPSEESGPNGMTLTKVTVRCSDLKLPFDVPGMLPEVHKISAIGISTQSQEPPPAFIRLGFKLIDPSVSNPSVTGATQVVMLPAYGFQTDAVIPGGGANVGGTANNNDVVADQPDATKCLWAGINASPNPLRSNAAYVTTPDGRYINTFN